MQVAPEPSPVCALVCCCVQVLHRLAREKRLVTERHRWTIVRWTFTHPTLLGGQQWEQRAAVHLSHQQFRHTEDHKHHKWKHTQRIIDVCEISTCVCTAETQHHWLASSCIKVKSCLITFLFLFQPSLIFIHLVDLLPKRKFNKKILFTIHERKNGEWGNRFIRQTSTVSVASLPPAAG